MSSITFLNFWQVTKSGCEKENNRWKKINEKRISALFVSNNVHKRKIVEVNGKNIITNQSNTNILEDTTLAILLMEPKCNKCQEKELKRLDLLKTKKSINIIGITTKVKKNEVASQIKKLKLNFLIYQVEDSVFYNNLAFNIEFPQIIYIIDGIVQSAFRPVPFDDKFSENYYNNLFSKIGN